MNSPDFSKNLIQQSATLTEESAIPFQESRHFVEY